MSNFHPLEVVGRSSETDLQMGENLKSMIYPFLPGITNLPNSICRRPGHTDRHFMYTAICV